jgi:hypothetical protein
MVKPVVAAVLALAFMGTWIDPVAAQTVAAPPPPAAQRPPACTDAAHRAFDFWIGAWDAYVTGTETLAGRSVIESTDAGCIITERWVSARAPYSGRSINLFDSTTGKWLQFWADSGGEITRYEGGPTATGMLLTAPDETAPGQQGKASLRMTFTRNPNGSVRQFGETSADGGRTWTTSYDFTYRRRVPR